LLTAGTGRDAVTAFVVLQLAEITCPACDRGDAAIRVLVSASLVGFVLVITATWLLAPTRPADERARHTGRTLWMQFTVVGLLFSSAGVGASAPVSATAARARSLPDSARRHRRYR